MPKLPKTPTNPKQLRAIATLEKMGFHRSEIMDAFGISHDTYYRRRREIRAFADRSQRLRENLDFTSGERS